ncbi:MAG: putative membrane protein [Candidatus Azotimanducaceae bacterium]|jgi:uncharacterized membrane protein
MSTQATPSSDDTSFSWLSKFSIGLMIFLSVCIGLYAFAFQAGMQGSPEFHSKFGDWSVFSSMHVIGGGIVIVTGGFQFWPQLRRDHINIHRWLGRIYLTFILIGGVGGLVIAPQSDGGLVAHFGFGMLAVLWLFSGWQAYACIRRGDIASHREWMMRNFAMTFGAVMLRIYLGLFAVAGVEFVDAYPTVAWIAWVPNLILVEWYLALKANKPVSAITLTQKI